MSHTSLHPTGTLSKFPLPLLSSRTYLLPSPLSLFRSTLSHTLQWQMIHLPLPPTRPTQAYARASVNAPLSSCQGFFWQSFLQCQGLLPFSLCSPSTLTSPVSSPSPTSQHLPSPCRIQISSVSSHSQALSACFKLGTCLIPAPRTLASPITTL